MLSRSNVVRWAAILVGLPVVALALVVTADAIPDRFVVSELHDAIENSRLSQQSYGVGYTGGRVDGFSECKRLTVGLGAEAGTSTLESAIRSPTLGACETAVPKVLGWASGEGLARSYDYFRYWNGSAAVLRPSVAAVGLTGTRLLAALGLLLVSVAWFLGARRTVGTLPATLLLAPVVVTTDFIDLPGALVHAIGMIVALGAAALLLWCLPPDASRQTYAAVAFVCGSASQFFGDLTNPDAAWALVVSAAAVLAVTALDVRSAAWRIVAAGVGWIAGFAWIWFTKWVVAALVLGYDTVRFVITNKAEERLGGDVGGVEVAASSGLTAAWDAWRGQPLTTLSVLALGLVGVVVVVRRGDLRSSWARRLLLASAATIPLVWHVVLRNHTATHFWFTYRSFAVAFGILLMALTVRIERGAEIDDDRTDQLAGQAQYGSTASGSMS